MQIFYVLVKFGGHVCFKLAINVRPELNRGKAYGFLLECRELFQLSQYLILGEIQLNPGLHAATPCACRNLFQVYSAKFYFAIKRILNCVISGRT